MELNAKLDGRRSGWIVDIIGRWGNGSLKEIVKAWLRGNLDVIKKAKWRNGRMGSDNVNVWVE